jgi:hypothetical protein
MTPCRSSASTAMASPARTTASHPSLTLVGEAALSGETEAFLEGRIVEHLAAAGRTVPTWAVLNKLAHANPEEIADLAERNGRPGNAPEPGEPAWQAAQRSLASRLLASGATPDQITRIQQAVLVPLELRRRAKPAGCTAAANDAGAATTTSCPKR